MPELEEFKVNTKELKEFIIDIVKYTGRFIIRNRK